MTMRQSTSGVGHLINSGELCSFLVGPRDSCHHRMDRGWIFTLSKRVARMTVFYQSWSALWRPFGCRRRSCMARPSGQADQSSGITETMDGRDAWVNQTGAADGLVYDNFIVPDRLHFHDNQRFLERRDV